MIDFLVHWVKQVALSVDELLNSLLFGWSDETFSSRCHRADRDGKWYGFCRKGLDTIFFWDYQHCKSAYINERNRVHLPPELRGGKHD